jgi:hypothetical protein
MKCNSIFGLIIFLAPLCGDFKDIEISLFDNQKDCVSIELCGEMGNALFRSAFAISQALDNEYSFLVNHKYKEMYPQVFSRFPLFTPLKNLTNYQYVNFVSSLGITIQPNTIISGYPHSYLYFDKYKKQICNLFQPSDQMVEMLKEKYFDILNNQDKYVGIHLRTFARNGDSALMYLSKKEVTYLRCSYKYYDRALQHFPKDSTFVVFSDNIDCAKLLLKKYKRKFIYIKNNSIEEDFYLLSLLKNVIITNSTFAWWAAYLNPHLEKNVVNPWPWHDYSSINETMTVDGKHAICPPEWAEYPIGDSFTDGFDDTIRRFLKNRK